MGRIERIKNVNITNEIVLSYPSVLKKDGDEH